MADPLYRRTVTPSGRVRYVEYGVYLPDVFPPGHHLVSVGSDFTSTLYRIDPDHAATLATLHECRDEAIAAVREAMALHPDRRLTPAQAAAWEALQATGVTLVRESPAAVVDALAAALATRVRRG